MWLVLRCLIPFIVINHTYHWWVINGGIHLLLQSGGFCNGFGRQHSLWCGKVCRLNKSRWELRSSGYLTSFFNIRRMLSNISRIDYNSWLTFINSGALEVGHVSTTQVWHSHGMSVPARTAFLYSGRDMPVLQTRCCHFWQPSHCRASWRVVTINVHAMHKSSSAMLLF